METEKDEQRGAEREREKDEQRGAERERERERERDIERETETERDREKERVTETERDRQREGERARLKSHKGSNWSGRHINKQQCYNTEAELMTVVFSVMCCVWDTIPCCSLYPVCVFIIQC